MKLKGLKLSLAAVLTGFFTLFSSSVVLADSLNYTTSLTRMNELGILSSSNTTSSYITRGELVKSIVISEGKSSSASNLTGSTIFPDIDPSNGLSGFINEGLNLGTNEGINQAVICGRADGYFHANDYVTYGELCTTMVRLLGYSDSDVTGAWPNNYIRKAADLNLTTDISLNKSDKVTLGVEAVMYDRLFDSVMKKSSTGSSKFFSDNYNNDTTVTGNLVETIVFGNSKTSDGLTSDQILTSTGTYTLKGGTSIPEVGGKYRLYVDGTTVTKVTPRVNTLVGYGVTSVSGYVVKYKNENGTDIGITLPEANAYYYHGKSISYDAAAKSIRAYSSIVVAKGTNGNNEYMVITDPTLSSPLLYRYDENNIDEIIANTDYNYIYKDGEEYESSSSVNFDSDDVVYVVSDLWGTSSSIYVYCNVVYGKITAVKPNALNPSSITVNVAAQNGNSSTQTVVVHKPDGTTETTTTKTSNSSSANSSASYNLSEYFQKSRLSLDESENTLNIGEDIELVLDINGEILDIH